MPPLLCRTLLKLERLWRAAWFRAHCRLWRKNVTLGRGAGVHQRVRVSTRDGGRIEIGAHCWLEDDCYLAAKGGLIQIGADGYLGHGVQIVAHQSVRIGAGALLSSYCVVRDAEHGTEPNRPMREQAHRIEPIVIGDDVWLGNHVVVTAGVTLGDGVAVGANAVVTRSIAPATIAVGVPARPLRRRDAASGAAAP